MAITHEISVNIESITPNVLDAGTKGSYGVYRIHPTFSPEWDGMTIKFSFYPSKAAPVAILYTESLAEYPYINIPQEATAKAGNCPFVISGIKDGVSLISLVGVLSVAETKKPAVTPAGSPTPTEIEQIYAAMSGESYLPTIGENGNWLLYNFALKQYVDSGLSSKGANGNSGVYRGDDEPADLSVNVWIDTKLT